MSGFEEYLLAEEAKTITGWDFSLLDGRWDSDPLPWDYAEIVRERLADNSRLLDMGTGGGEFLLSLGHPPRLCSVTEGYAPNLELCRRRLAPLGITVKESDNLSTLPFSPGAFDIVINRHESYLPAAVSEVLRTGGFFVTQQVGGLNNRAMSELLIDEFVPPYPRHNAENAKNELVAAGFECLYVRESFPRLRFFDIGAVVIFARIIEWEFPGFSVANCLDKLRFIDGIIKKDGCFESVEHRFVAAAQKRG